MTISRTILVILAIFVLTLLEALDYIWQRTNPRYLMLDKAIHGNSNAGRIIWTMICCAYYTIVENIVIHKEGYLYMKKSKKHPL